MQKEQAILDNAQKDVQSELNTVYSNAVGRSMLNFGRVVTPLARSLEMVVESTAVNKRCDQTCAVEFCMDRQTFEFDHSCMKSACNC